MRILHIVDPFLAISENWIYPQVAKTPGVTPLVLCDSTQNEETFPMPPGSILRRVQRPQTRSFPSRVFAALVDRLGYYQSRTMELLRSARPDVLHAHFGPRSWNALPIKRHLGVPLVSSFYGYDAWRLPISEPIWKEKYHTLFREADAFLVEGPAMSARMRDLGCPASKIHVWRLGVDLGTLKFAQRTFASPLRAIMVGRFVEKKGMLDGLKGCASAVSQGLDLRITIVGDCGSNDPEGQQIRDSLKAIAAAPPLAGRVDFAGFRPLAETRNMLASHDIMLCPSRLAASGDAEGGSPVVLTEAMALGLACVGTRHCDIPEVILHRETGFLCDENDPAGLAACLLEMAGDRTKLSSMTAAGRKHIEEKFNLASQLDALPAIYESVRAKPSRN